MPSLGRILLYGHDHALLVTRTLLFEKAGYTVRSTLSQQEAERFSDVEAFDLLVLCHTLNRGEQEQTMRAVHVLKPHQRGLALTNGRVPPSGDGTLMFADRLEGPGSVLACIEGLLPQPECRTTPMLGKVPGYSFAARAENAEILVNYTWSGKPEEAC